MTDEPMEIVETFVIGDPSIKQCGRCRLWHMPLDVPDFGEVIGMCSLDQSERSSEDCCAFFERTGAHLAHRTREDAEREETRH